MEKEAEKDCEIFLRGGSLERVFFAIIEQIEASAFWRIFDFLEVLSTR